MFVAIRKARGETGGWRGWIVSKVRSLEKINR
jgi:hypothetical protein